MSDGRRFGSVLEAKLEREGDRVALLAPRPGLFRDGPELGSLVRAGALIGSLEVLGAIHRVRAPAGAFGVVSELPEGRRLARRPVGYGTRLVTLDPEGVSAGAALVEGPSDTRDGGPVFRTPIGGRFYAKPAVDEPPFVNVGDALKGGETVALIEVMKTFNRVCYAGTPATVTKVVPSDGDDIEIGDVLLELA